MNGVVMDQNLTETITDGCCVPTLEKKATYEFVKRVFDILFSISALVVASPLMLIIAIYIRAEDGGPVIFKQTRLTQNGKPFTMYKFRSMVVDAESQLEKLLPQNELDGPAFKIGKDPRITKIGRFIRKTSIDELPQFHNVLHGDMSIIGPRPPLPREAAQYTEYQRHRLDVKAGIACIHEVSGRSNEKNFDVWVEQDLEYIQTRSVVTDLKIMGRLVKTVLRCYGAS